MKLVRWIGIALGLYVGLVVVFESLMGIVQPASDGTLVITTMDADGTAHERVVSRIESGGRLYVAANHWPRAWFERAKAHPAVKVTMDGQTGDYTAALVTGAEHDRVAADKPLGPIFRFLTGFPPRYFLRLDAPAGAG